MLAGYGVTHVFMVPAVLRRTFAEMERRTSIRRIHTHGEKSAAYMADGYARASGRPGVCMAQVVGALNLAAGLRDAYLAHSPVIAFTGGREPRTKFRQVYQEVDDVPSFEPVTKWNATIDAVERFPDMVRQAFRVAVSGAPGPVHLQFRGNEGQIDQEEAEMAPLVEPQFARVPPFRPEPERAHVLAALAALQSAERPVIVAGGGVRASGAGLELVALAEKLGVPVATSLNGKDTIPGTHPLAVGVVGSYSRESANRVVAGADLVCFVGTTAGGMTTHFWAVPKVGVRAIQIDIDPETLGRNYPLEAGGARRCKDRARADARARGHVDRRTPARLARHDAQHLPRVAREVPPAARLRRRADPPGAHLCRADEARAGRRDRRRRHRPRRHVDGRDVRPALAAPELPPQRRSSRLGVPCRSRREVRRARSPGGDLHRRRRPLVSHRRDRDRGALEDQRGHRRQQQRERQPVEARLRPRLRRASRPSRRASCGPSTRSTSRASPRRWARSGSGSSGPPTSRRRSGVRSPRTGRRSSTWSTDIDAIAPTAVA